MQAAEAPLLLGIDNGLTATKAALFDGIGRMIGVARVPTRLATRRPGCSEIGMMPLWQATSAAIRQVMATTEVAPGRVAAVGLSGHGNGLYRLDRADRPIEPAFSSMDHRALSIVDSLGAEAAQVLKHITLQSLWSGQPGILLRWLRDNDPENYRRTNTVFFCKDWIRTCLTGEVATDLTDASASGLFDNQQRAYSPEVLRLLGIAEAGAWLPKTLSSTAVAGRVRSQVAQETGLPAGIPVVGGLFDVTANPIGSGLVSEGQYCTVAGTWSLNVALSREPREPTAVRQCTIYGDGVHHSFIDSSATSASNLAWFLDKVLEGQCSYEGFERAISRFGPNDVGALFLPFIHGGLRDDDPGACFLGLRAAHGRDELLRAIAEGIAFSHRYHIQNLRREGLSGDRVLFTGGASRNRPLCQLLADVLQLPLFVPDCEETGALGACMVAAVGTGLYPSVGAAVAQMARARTSYAPELAHGEIYQQKYEHFCAALRWLSPLR